MYRNELYHYGVKGMKWGVRKSISSKISSMRSRHKQNKRIKKRVGSINKAQRKRYAETDISKLSDNELRNLNSRIDLENQYKAKAAASTSRGILKNVINTGKDVVVNSLKSSSGKLIGAVALTAAAAYGSQYVKEFLKKHPSDTMKVDEVVDIFQKHLKPKAK